MDNLIKSILFAGVFFSSQALYAAGLYFDGGLGNADVELGNVDDSDIYMRIGIGGELSDTLSVEGGFWDLGDFSGGGASVSVDGIYGNLKASMPLEGKIRLFGKVGLYMWDAGAEDGNDLFFGGGVSFGKIGPGDLSAEIILMDLDEADATTIGASYSIPFK